MRRPGIRMDEPSHTGEQDLGVGSPWQALVGAACRRASRGGFRSLVGYRMAKHRSVYPSHVIYSWRSAYSEEMYCKCFSGRRNSCSPPCLECLESTTGSLLVATSAEEARSLESHVDKIAAAGVNAEFLTPSQVSEVEPSLEIGHEGGAAFVPGDSQIDAALAVAFIRQVGGSSSSFFSFASTQHGHYQLTVMRRKCTYCIYSVGCRNDRASLLLLLCREMQHFEHKDATRSFLSLLWNDYTSE